MAKEIKKTKRNKKTIYKQTKKENICLKYYILKHTINYNENNNYNKNKQCQKNVF